MRPWLVDAKNLELSDVELFESSLLHPTRQISDFLSTENKVQLFVIAPKGFGKTLLLKAKKLTLSRVMKCLPENAILDKPGSDPGVLSSTEYVGLRDAQEYWKSAWLTALSLCLLKATKLVPTGLTEPLLSLSRNEKLLSACDIFHAILQLSRSRFFAARSDYNTCLLPSIRTLHAPIALFLDNIDENFESFLRPEDAGSLSGELDPNYWYFAQIGVALAAFELNGINNHIKVYVSIRKEVFQRAFMSGANGLQLRGSAIDISYAKDDLIQIICRNIDQEADSVLKSEMGESVERFLGSDCLRLVHPITGDEEPVTDLWLRHSLGRPRDIAFTGSLLSQVAPKARTERTVRETIRRAAREIGQTYLAEMAPHLAGFEHARLLEMIPQNVLTRKDLERISAEYAQSPTADGNGRTEHPFCALFKIGLLGYVGVDPETRDFVQEFRRPGELPLDEASVLPNADIFLVHPILDELVGQRNPSYFKRLDPTNIIGPGLRWNPTREASFVLAGDVVGYSDIMADPVASRSFPRDLQQLVFAQGTELSYAKTEGGDGILLIDENPFTLLSAARAIQRTLEQSPYKCQVRFGGDAGFVEIDKSGATPVLRGLAVRISARLEPLAPPGSILVSGEFVSEGSRRFGAGRIIVDEARPEALSKVPHRDGEFNIAKSGEAPINRKLFFVRTSSLATEEDSPA